MTENAIACSLILSSLLLLLPPVHPQKTLTFPLISHSTVTKRRRRRLTAGNALSDKTNTITNEDNIERVETGSLYQGDGVHYVDLWVGHPTPQRQTVIVDTGSHLTGFPCGTCQDCGLEIKLDSAYNHSLSDSFSFVQCDACVSGKCHKDKNVCLMGASYAEGSAWTALESKDRVYYGGHHEAPMEERRIQDGLAGGDKREHKLQANDFSFDMTFGCQFDIKGCFLKQKESGIMGMMNREGAFINQMYDAKVIDKKMFSLCLYEGAKDGDPAGAMTMGGANEKLWKTPLVYAKSPENSKLAEFYRTKVKAIYLWDGAQGGFKTNITAFANDANKETSVKRIYVSEPDLDKLGTIVDSGTTSTYFPGPAKEPFLNAWKEWVGTDMVATSRVNMNAKQARALGFTLTTEQLKKVPTVLVQLEGVGNEHMDADTTPGLVGSALDPENPHDVIVAIPPSKYLIYNDDGQTFLTKIHFMDKMPMNAILGANMMTGYDVVFDVDNQKVGFAESECSYDE